MLRTALCDLIGIRHPIIQAGMGPYSTNRLATAVANTGALGIISTSGLILGDLAPQLTETVAAGEKGTAYELLKKILYRVKEATKDSKGIFGINCLVSAEMALPAGDLVRAVIDARDEDQDMKERLRVIITSAGDPVPWAEMIKPSGVKWFHVVPSVRHAQRCERAGVDGIIASGHEGGYHVSWEPVHTMVLLPAVVNAVKIPVVGAGGFCDGATQEDCGTHLYPGMPWKMSKTPLRIRRGPARLGEDNEYVYKKIIRVSDEEYAKLGKEGHIGMDFVEP